MLGAIILFVHKKYALKGLTMERLSLSCGECSLLLFYFYFHYLSRWCYTMLLTDVISIQLPLMQRWWGSYIIPTFVSVFWTPRGIF